jgi:predicted dehydrogenase
MNTITRREFVNRSAKGAATLAAGAGLLTATVRAQVQGANEKVILGLIGAGGRGSALAGGLAQLPNVEFKYVCDANRERGAGLMADLAKKQARPPRRVVDLREVLDDKEVNGVVVATPEHWHALATVWACQAGKDVYVEKNTSLTLWEGRKMIEAARKYQRVVQVGFQNRSAPYAVSARAYLQSGKLGKVVLVKVYNLLEGGAWNPRPDSAPPAELDWDLWLGPAPEAPYNAGRHQGWNDWWDYCGGAFSGDASHQLDLTRMVLGDPPTPKSVYCAGGRLAFPDKREIPDLFAVTYDYGDFVMTCESGTFAPYMRKFPNEVRYGTQWPHWPQSSCRVEIYGTKQLMYLGRHGCGWQVLEAGGKVVAQDKGYFPDKWHQPNFVECIRTRKQPNADIEQAHQSACLIHLGAAAYRVGKKHLLFDPQTERFTNSDEANRLLKPAYRKHYRVPEQV